LRTRPVCFSLSIIEWKARHGETHLGSQLLWRQKQEDSNLRPTRVKVQKPLSEKDWGAWFKW
jgi:hypothetical protein